MSRQVYKCVQKAEDNLTELELIAPGASFIRVRPLRMSGRCVPRVMDRGGGVAQPSDGTPNTWVPHPSRTLRRVGGRLMAQ